MNGDQQAPQEVPNKKAREQADRILLRMQQSQEQAQRILAQQQVEQGAFGNAVYTGLAAAGMVSPVVADRPLPTPGEVATGAVGATGAIASGMARKGFLEPGMNLLDLFGIDSPKQAYIKALAEGKVGAADKLALDMGVTPEALIDLNNVGAFLGFVVPVSASLKLASWGGRGISFGMNALRTGPALPAAPALLTTSQILRDWAAGGIYGFAFREGEDIQERLKHAFHESAIFGLFGIGLSGIGAGRNFWNRRKYDSITQDAAALSLGLVEARQGILPQQAIDPLTGLRPPRAPMDPITGISPLVSVGKETGLLGGQIKNQLTLIAMNPAAIQLYKSGLVEAALMEGTIDVMGSGASHGMLKNVGDLMAARAAVKNIGRDLKHLKFDILGNKSGSYDIIFGPTGLSNKQKLQYKAEGFYDGQSVTVNNTRGFEYVKPGKVRESGGDKYNTVVIKDLADNSTMEVREFNADGNRQVFGQSWGTPNMELLGMSTIGNTRVSVLVRDFENWFLNSVDDVSKARGDMSEAQVILEAKSGRLKLDPDAKREFIGGNVIVHPEEALLGADGFPLARHKAKQVKQGFDLVSSDGKRVAPIPLEPGPTQGSLVIPAGKLDKEFAQLSRQEMMAVGEDILKGAKEQGIDLVYYQGQVLAETAEGSILRRGFTDIWPLHPDEFGGFEQIVDQWLADRGITAIADRLAFRTYAAHQLRKTLYAKIPKEERVLLEALKKEIRAIEYAEGAISLERMAGARGISIERQRNGSIISRDIDTAKPEVFSDEATAWASISQRDVGPRIGEAQPLPESVMDMGMGGLNGMDESWRASESAWVWGEPDAHWLDVVDDMVPGKMLPGETLTNLRDWLIQIEEKTGLKLWTQGFNKIDIGTQTMRADLRTIVPPYMKLWKGIHHKDRLRMGEWAKRMVSGDKPMAWEIAVLEAKAMGISPRQIETMKKNLHMLDEILKPEGFTALEAYEAYYKFVQPIMERDGVLDLSLIFKKSLKDLPKPVRNFVNYMHTGELPMGEIDPLMVTLKMIRTTKFNQHVYPHWRKVRDLVDPNKVGVAARAGKPANWLGLGELPDSQRNQILKALGGNTEMSLEKNAGLNRLVEVLSEYTALVRGYPSADQRGLRRLTSRFFSKMGLRADDRVLEDLIHSYLSLTYGAAMGLRPMLVSRNLMQNYWTSYVRLGPKYGGAAVERAMTYEGFVEALNANAIRSESGGVFAGEIVLDNMIVNTETFKANGLMGLATKGAMVAASRGGRLSRRMSEKMLKGYTSADDLNRAWAFHWQKMHTEEWLKLWRRGEASKEGFIEQGLPYFSKTVKDEFMDRLTRFGQTDALNFIGKMAADENHFIYGAFAQPLWMQKTFGRLLGQFGTWPIWYKEMIVNRFWRNGTPAQRVTAGARLAIVGGVTSSIALGSGLNIWSWLAPGSLVGYFGGPSLDYIYDVRNIVQAPMSEVPTAIARMGARFGRLGYPGQTFVRDVTIALKGSDDPRDIAMSIFVGRPEFAGRPMTDITLQDGYLLQEPFVDPERRMENRLRTMAQEGYKIPFAPRPDTTEVQ